MPLIDTHSDCRDSTGRGVRLAELGASLSEFCWKLLHLRLKREGHGQLCRTGVCWAIYRECLYDAAPIGHDRASRAKGPMAGNFLSICSADEREKGLAFATNERISFSIPATNVHPQLNFPNCASLLSLGARSVGATYWLTVCSRHVNSSTARTMV